jgi:hypothetical protein
MIGINSGATVPVDLHQRLSEFSYGYGVTREVERLLQSAGLRTTPFLPSLLQEKKLAFDVAFDRPGAPLLLQFKLGEAYSDLGGKMPLSLPRSWVDRSGASISIRPNRMASSICS